MRKYLNKDRCRSREQLYFLHIPKTAGTTFSAVLDAYFSAEEICPAQLWRDLVKISPDKLERYLLLRGHFYYYVHRILPQPPRYLTLLRDPVERTLSHYQHIRRDAHHFFHKKVQGQHGLLDFINDAETRPMIANFQTRALALDLDPVSMAASFDETALQASALEKALTTAMPVSMSVALLDKAKERLARFAFVGLTERFHESVLLLCATFGWHPPDRYAALNFAPERLQRAQLSDATLAAIEEHTRLDAELYQFAQELFETRLAAMARQMPASVPAAIQV